MKVSHQIRHQRESLGLSVGEVASKVGVTEQAVRHWESGRSYPSKAKARDVERALEFSIDWSEGERSAGEGMGSSAAMINPKDLDLLLLLCRLPGDFKRSIEEIAGLHLKAIEGRRFSEREETLPVGSFSDREQNGVNETPKRKSAAGPGRGKRRA